MRVHPGRSLPYLHLGFKLVSYSVEPVVPAGLVHVTSLQITLWILFPELDEAHLDCFSLLPLQWLPSATEADVSTDIERWKSAAWESKVLIWFGRPVIWDSGKGLSKGSRDCSVDWTESGEIKQKDKVTSSYFEGNMSRGRRRREGANNGRLGRICEQKKGRKSACYSWRWPNFNLPVNTCLMVTCVWFLQAVHLISHNQWLVVWAWNKIGENLALKKL